MVPLLAGKEVLFIPTSCLNVSQVTVSDKVRTGTKFWKFQCCCHFGKYPFISTNFTTKSQKSKD